MNVTPPTSGNASAQPTNSSLADFLLAGAPADPNQNFREIAAALFGVESSTASPTQTPAKEPTAGGKTVTNPPEGELKTRKSKEPADPNSAAAHPELPAPVPTPPAPLLDALPKPDAATDPVGPPDINAALKEPVMFGALAVSDGDHKLVDASSNQPALPSNTPKMTTPPSTVRAQDTQLPFAIEGDAGSPPALGGSPTLVAQAPSADGVAQPKKSAAASGASPITNTTAKKTADGSDQLRTTELVKPVSTPASNSDQPAQPTPAPLTVTPNQEAAAVDPIPSAAMLEPATPASASGTPDNSITAKGAQPSGAIIPGVAADPKGVSGAVTPGQSSKTKDRQIKDREIKDTKMSSTQRGKMANSEADDITGGLTKSAASSSKDVAGVTSGTHSDTHTKAILLKQSGGPSSSPTAEADDAPDEALPTSMPTSVTTAKLVQGMSQSEFRVGMQTQEFGNIDIRTSVARHMFSAQISVEHNDVAKSMTADLPALYHKLADQHVAVASIVIQGQSFATSSGLAQDAQPQTWRPQSYNVTKSNAETALPVLTETLDSAGRLDIRI